MSTDVSRKRLVVSVWDGSPLGLLGALHTLLRNDRGALQRQELRHNNGTLIVSEREREITFLPLLAAQQESRPPRLYKFRCTGPDSP